MGGGEACGKSIRRNRREASGRVPPRGPSGDVIPREHCDPVVGGSGAECQICQQQSSGPYCEGFPGERSEPVKADDVELDGVDSGEIPPAGL